MQSKKYNSLDSHRYLAAPHKNDLDLNHALDFTSEKLPDEFDIVSEYFRSIGVYSRLKNCW